jgi:uncharacterized Fe-S cluster-containing protein
MKKITKTTKFEVPEFPGHDCGSCGFRTCEAFEKHLGDVEDPATEVERCIHLSNTLQTVIKKREASASCGGCGGTGVVGSKAEWMDSLGRIYDFILDTFPGDAGPRETIIPHNPCLTREMDIQIGDKLYGRPLGMSCGCPITHCGEVVAVDHKTGVMTWCVTGPLGPRREKYTDIGYYSAEAYDGLVKEARTELKIGMRYFFLPDRCMLQWRHSGLVNFINKGRNGLAIRVEGLWIG